MRPDLARLIAERVAGTERFGDVRALADDLLARAGPGVQALIFFGSRRSGAATDESSAYDMFVVVDSYRKFYGALHQSGATARPAALLTGLSVLMPPTQICVQGRSSGVRAKYSVISARHLARETSLRRRHDHFCVARLFQPTQLVYVRDPDAQALALDALVSAHRATFQWSRPWLPDTFDAGEYTQRLLEVSLKSEVRPEPGGRAGQLWAVQRDYLLAVYAGLLEELVDAGELARVSSGRYRLARPVSALYRLRIWTYFRVSLVRTTLRWGKHMLSFEGWLDYIVQKVARHGGGAMTLTERERRWPLVFLWPRVVRYLRAKRRADGLR
jgi:hypothetical protein